MFIPAFCRAVNNLFDDYAKQFYLIGPSSRRMISFAFENIPSDHVIFQSLVDKYCFRCKSSLYGYSLEAMQELPIAFIRRAFYQIHELSKMSVEEKGKKRCYKLHASDDEVKKRKALHIRWDEN